MSGILSYIPKDILYYILCFIGRNVDLMSMVRTCKELKSMILDSHVLCGALATGSRLIIPNAFKEMKLIFVLFHRKFKFDWILENGPSFLSSMELTFLRCTYKVFDLIPEKNLVSITDHRVTAFSNVACAYGPDFFHEKISLVFEEKEIYFTKRSDTSLVAFSIKDEKLFVYEIDPISSREGITIITTTKEEIFFNRLFPIQNEKYKILTSVSDIKKVLIKLEKSNYQGLEKFDWMCA